MLVLDDTGAREWIGRTPFAPIACARSAACFPAEQMTSVALPGRLCRISAAL